MESWLSNPLVLRVVNHFLDQLDRQDLSSRSRMPGFRLSDKFAPEIYAPVEAGQAEYSWQLIRELEKKGLIEVKLDGKRESDLDYEVLPRPYIKMTLLSEGKFRKISGREHINNSYVNKWNKAVKNHLSEDVSFDKFKSTVLKVPGRKAAEVVQRFVNIKDVLKVRRYLRGVSAELFWGLSKILDNKSEFINSFLSSEKQILENPVLLHIDVPVSEINALLFIENLTSFVEMAAMRPSIVDGYVLIFSSGYKATADRVRSIHGQMLFFTGGSVNQQSNKWIKNYIVSEKNNLPTYLWGDLDFEGLKILKQLKLKFLNLEAWKPGYEKMMGNIEVGNGHNTSEAGKEKQQDPIMTGCEYTDTIILPFIRKNEKYLDQEAIVFT